MGNRKSTVIGEVMAADVAPTIADLVDESYLHLCHAYAITDLVRVLAQSEDSSFQDCRDDTLVDALHCVMVKIETAQELVQKAAVNPTVLEVRKLASAKVKRAEVKS